MKYNWPAVVKEFRKIMLEHVKLYAVHDDPTPDKGFMEHLRCEMFDTDTFHPWETDGELSRALEKMPTRCDYRSCKSYWAWKDGKDRIGDAIFDVLTEMNEIIYEFYINKWNFAPGVDLPEDIVFADYNISDKIVNRIIRAAKKA